jgi:endonuclease/exonuclease/phosphatase family metal-dependent hydrolase
MFDPTINGHVDGWQGDWSGKRIDYIYLRKGSLFKVQEAHSIFTPSDYERVSDHAGIYAISNYPNRPDS